MARDEEGMKRDTSNFQYGSIELRDSFQETGWGGTKMSTETSQQVMALLKELSMLKQVDANLEEHAVRSERDEHKIQRRKKRSCRRSKLSRIKRKMPGLTSSDTDSEKQQKSAPGK
jgi:hypothetical protein